MTKVKRGEQAIKRLDGSHGYHLSILFDCLLVIFRSTNAYLY